jgi:hypothetical protein
MYIMVLWRTPRPTINVAYQKTVGLDPILTIRVRF